MEKFKKTIYFVRHGQSQDNARSAHSSIETSLTEKGVREMTFLANRLKQLPIDVVIASAHPRTKQSAELISVAIGKPVRYDELVVEVRKPSVVRGKLKSDPEAMAIMQTIATHRSEAGWHHSDEENFADRKNRANSIIAMLERDPAEHILVITHSGVTKSTVAAMLFGPTMTSAEYYGFIEFTHMKNTGITICKLLADDRWKLITWNDVAHLEEVA